MFGAEFLSWQCWWKFGYQKRNAKFSFYFSNFILNCCLWTPKICSCPLNLVVSKEIIFSSKFYALLVFSNFKTLIKPEPLIGQKASFIKTSHFQKLKTQTTNPYEYTFFFFFFYFMLYPIFWSSSWSLRIRMENLIDHRFQIYRKQMQAIL